MKFLFIFLLSSLQVVGQKKDYRWEYIDNPYLQLIKNNVQKTGTVTKVYYEADGDLHVWMMAGTKSINCEIICYRHTSQCKDYINHFSKPKVGQRIRVVGDYVYDNKHKWYEIHPVKTMTIL
jgi:hypothetical protein